MKSAMLLLSVDCLSRPAILTPLPYFVKGIIALKPEGLQRTVLLLAITKPARLYVSAAVFAEYRDVLSRQELQIRKGLRQQLLQLVGTRAHWVVPTRRLQVASDPGDNLFLECADAARADYLLTGNT